MKKKKGEQGKKRNRGNTGKKGEEVTSGNVEHGKQGGKQQVTGDNRGNRGNKGKEKSNRRNKG